jgi:large conductance mechanosensitive channel
MFKDFKKFILRGNVVDLAVAVVLGAAFNAVIQGFVKDFITPLITGITGANGATIKGIETFTLFHKHFVFNWGDFVSLAISFILIAAVVFFLVVQPINKLTTVANRDKTTPEPSTKKCPECLSEIPKKATRCAFCQIKLKADK